MSNYSPKDSANVLSGSSFAASSYNIHDFIREAEQQQTFYQSQIARFDEVLQQQTQSITELEKKHRGALRTLTEILMPSFSEEYCVLLAQRLSKPLLAKMYGEYCNERKALQERLQQIEQTKDFQQADTLTNPKTGILPKQIAELKPYIEEAKSLLAVLCGMKGFQRLLDNKYGRKDYVHQGLKRFLSPEYYADVSDAEAIMKERGVQDFLDVLNKYYTAQDRLATLVPEIQYIQDHYTATLALIDEHKQLSERIGNLSHYYMERVVDVVGEYCSFNDKEIILRLFAAVSTHVPETYPLLESAFKQFDGTVHQIEYLRALQGKVTDERNALVQKVTSLLDEVRRYKSDQHRFRHKHWNSEQFSRKFKRDTSRYDRSVHRYKRTERVIYSFDDYNRISPLEEFLWWDVMTDGRLDGNFIPEVQEFYDEHPDYQYESLDYADDSVDTDQS